MHLTAERLPLDEINGEQLMNCDHTSEITEPELYTAASFSVAEGGAGETTPHSDVTSLLQQKLCVSEEGSMSPPNLGHKAEFALKYIFIENTQQR